MSTTTTTILTDEYRKRFYTAWNLLREAQDEFEVLEYEAREALANVSADERWILDSLIEHLDNASIAVTEADSELEWVESQILRH